MKELSLSIEELIYGFYSEGYFEQGNGLKQVYFENMSDEQMDLILQTTCRSLLAKGLLYYKDHKFTLKEDLAAVISALNFSEQSIKASRHNSGGGEESLSFHINQGRFIQHGLHYDEQVHSFKMISKEEAVKVLGGFFQITNTVEEQAERLEISRENFEGLLDLIDQQIYQSPNLSAQESVFMNVLGEGKGLLNTLIFMEFNENREAEAKEVVLFTNREKDNWMIEQDDHTFYVGPVSEAAIGSMIDRNIHPQIDAIGREQIVNGK